MGLFKENKWETNEVADKMSVELAKRKKSKIKKLSMLKNAKSKTSVQINTAIKKLEKDKKLKKITDNKAKDENLSSVHLLQNKDLHQKKVKKRKQEKQQTKSNLLTDQDSDKRLPTKEKAQSSKIILNNSTEKPKTKKRNKKKNKVEEITENKDDSQKNIHVTQKNVKKRKQTELDMEQIKKNTIKKVQHKKPNLNIVKLQELLLEKEGKGISTKKNVKPLSLRERMMAKLKTSRFRYLNEKMYNSRSFESKNYFKEDPEAFFAYHEGYKSQVNQWPMNPLDIIIDSIKKMPKDYVIADFGCGEAKLADSVPQKIHSFDLIAVNEKVKACDMSHTPLLTSSINVVVFCLSLMGTNLCDYITEANRVLKKGGILKIAEVESRFHNIEEFIKALHNYGFKNTWKDLSYNLFYFLDFKKENEIIRKNKQLPEIILKPCLYKKR